MHPLDRFLPVSGDHSDPVKYSSRPLYQYHLVLFEQFPHPLHLQFKVIYTCSVLLTGLFGFAARAMDKLIFSKFDQNMTTALSGRGWMLNLIFLMNEWGWK